MFSALCDKIGRQVLMGPRRITRFGGGADGLTFDYICVCGAPGSYHAANATGGHADTGQRHQAA